MYLPASQIWIIELDVSTNIKAQQGKKNPAPIPATLKNMLSFHRNSDYYMPLFTVFQTNSLFFQGIACFFWAKQLLGAQLYGLIGYSLKEQLNLLEFKSKTLGFCQVSELNCLEICLNFVINIAYLYKKLGYINLVYFQKKQKMFEIFGLDGNKKIGMLLIGLAAVFYTLGVLLFFKRSLILISNVLFLAGLYFFIGIFGIISFFSRKGKIKGSIIFFSGFILIVFGMAILGSLMQIMGLLIIFRQFLPDFYDYVCKTPLVGKYLKSYSLQNLVDSFAGNQKNRI